LLQKQLSTTLPQAQPPLSRFAETSPQNPRVKVKIIMRNFYCVFGGEPIESRDGKSLEGVGEQRYYPFGETRLTTGTIFTDKLFTGQRDMAGLGIYHYGARFYSPKLGRFLSADTIVPNFANPQDFNRYSYVRNNPLRYTDPSGNIPIDCYNDPSYCSNTTTLPSSPYKPKLGRGGGGSDKDKDGDGTPNTPDRSYPATNQEIETSVSEDCLPGNLVECFYSQGLMPSGDYDITTGEYQALLTAVSYDINNQGPIVNYELRGEYDTPFFNKNGDLAGTICINGVQCRDRSEYNYIAQGAWSAAALEGREGMLAVIVGWKFDKYQTLPSFNTIVSANEGFDYYMANHPANFLYMLYGPNNYASVFMAFMNNVILDGSNP